MINNIFEKLKTIKLWNLLWISLILSEVFTAIMDILMGLLWWGRIDLDLMIIGSINAFVVALVVSIILILLFRQIRNYERHAEDVVKSSKEEWEQTFNSMTDLIMIVDTKHKVLRTNKAMADKLRLTPSETAGLICYEHVHGLTEPPSFCPHSMLLSDGQEHSAEVYEEGLGGYFLVTVTPVFNARREVVGSVHTAKDITERKLAEQALKESEGKFRILFESATDAILILDMEGNFIDINKTAHERLGYSKEEMLSMHLSKLDTPEFADKIPVRIEQLKQLGQHVFESAHQRKDGTSMPVEINTRIIDFHGKKAMLSVIRDITERKRTEEKLRETNTMLQTLIQAIPDVVFFKDAQNRYLIANRAMEEFTGLSQGQLAGKTDKELLPPDLAEDCRKSDEMVAATLKVVRFEEQYTRVEKKGFVDTIKAPVFDVSGNLAGLVGVSRDITERKQMEEDLRRSSREKDTLLQEIHHRVKNNMQVISSMLKLQARTIDEPRMAAIFEDCQSRIRSMALVHEELYQSRNLSQIDIKHYINALLHGLSSSVYKKATVRFKVAVDDLFFNIDTAIPCGLIITELVTNSFKHAFPKQAEGEVSIELHRKDDMFHLSVKDNGVGLPPGFDLAKTQSLGLQLIYTLARQLVGTVEMKSVHGTEVNIAFRERHNNKEVQ